MGYEVKGVVHCLRNLVDGKVYVGSTTQPRIRKKQHFTDLRCGRHFNQHLHRAFGKHGEINFEWLLLKEGVESENLGEAEKFYITSMNALDKEFGYNMVDEPYAPMRGRRHSQATIAKMKNGSRKGVNHPNAKMNDEKYTLAFELHRLGKSRRAISDTIGVGVDTVSLLLRGKIWTHIKAKTIHTRKSKSGVTGVYKTANGKWMAEIKKNGKRIHLGTHEEFEMAVKARKTAERGE